MPLAGKQYAKDAQKHMENIRAERAKAEKDAKAEKKSKRNDDHDDD